MPPHVVRQGEYLSQIASRLGVAPEEIWNDDRNSDLRSRRDSPEVLAPGDVLFVPEAPAPAVRVSARTTNRYRAAVPTIPVAVVLEIDGEAVAGARAVIEGPVPPIEASTDGQGNLRFDAPMNIDRVRVRLPDQDFTFDLRIGHLDPADESTGVASRLQNLGYLDDGHEDLPEDAREAEVRAAVARFQHDRGIDVSGEVDDRTRDALTEEYGM